MTNPALPSARVPATDIHTGIVTREWYQFFSQLFTSTGGASGVDGDKGDITISGSGATYTIDAGVVSTSKLGVDITTAGKSLLDDASSSAQRTTLGISAANTPYTESTVSDWDGNVDPGAVNSALDQLARRATTLETAALSPTATTFISIAKWESL